MLKVSQRERDIYAWHFLRTCFSFFFLFFHSPFHSHRGLGAFIHLAFHCHPPFYSFFFFFFFLFFIHHFSFFSCRNFVKLSVSKPNRSENLRKPSKFMHANSKMVKVCIIIIIFSAHFFLLPFMHWWCFGWLFYLLRPYNFFFCFIYCSIFTILSFLRCNSF